MHWESLFSLTNGWALLGWVMLILLPRRPLVISAITYGVVAMLCLAYVLMFASLLSGGEAGGGSAAPIMSLAWVMALFYTPAGTVIGWTHYLAFDLFVGLWIARDADAKGFRRIWQAPILLLTLLAGPVGLLLWLIVREPAARRAARARGPA